MPRQPAALADPAPRAVPDPALIRLLHRRRSWAWMAGAAASGLAAFAVLAAGRLIPPSLHDAALLATDFLALTAAAGAGAALDETRFLRCAAPGARAAAAAAAGLHPVIWYAHRAPRQVQGRGAALLILLVLLIPAAVTLSGQASAVACLAGARAAAVTAAGQCRQGSCTSCSVFPRHLVSGGPAAALMILLPGFFLDLLAAYGITALLAQARSIIPGPGRAADAAAHPLAGRPAWPARPAARSPATQESRTTGETLIMPRPPASAAGVRYTHLQIALALTAMPTTFGSGVVFILASHHLLSYWWLALTLGWAAVPLAVYLRMQRYARQLRLAGPP